MCTAPCDRGLRRGGATSCRPTIGEYRLISNHIILIAVTMAVGISASALVQCSLMRSAAHSSVEHSHALSQAGLRASTRKNERQRIDWESSKGENQRPVSSILESVHCYDDSYPHPMPTSSLCILDQALPACLSRIIVPLPYPRAYGAWSCWDIFDRVLYAHHSSTISARGI